MTERLFRPLDGGTKTLAVTSTTGNVALGHSGAFEGDEIDVRVMTAPGGATTFIRFGASGVVATVAAGIPIPPGVPCGFTVPSGTTHVAAITASGTATLYATPQRSS